MSKSWRTRDGRWIKIHKMTDDHLRNTLAMLIRCAKTRKHRADMEVMTWESNGEIASDAIEHEQNEIWSKHPEEYIAPVYYDLKEEAKKRGIKIPEEMTQ